MKLSDFDFNLPDTLIATRPVVPRSSARMLVAEGDAITDAKVRDLPGWLRDLSPLSHPAQLPAEEFALLPLVVLSAIAVVGVAVGLLGLRRRQIGVR